MTMYKCTKIVFIGLLSLIFSSLSTAQSPTSETVLTGNQVTRDSLINALKPDSTTEVATDGEAPRDASPLKARGFKIAVPSPIAPTPHKASLLITFAVDSAKLTKESNAMLDLMAEAMQSEALAGSNFNIEGHADPRGDEAHNVHLSQQRAESVMAYLIERRGIAKDRLRAKGKGSSELLNTQQQEAPENRRVTFVTLK